MWICHRQSCVFFLYCLPTGGDIKMCYNFVQLLSSSFFFKSISEKIKLDRTRRKYFTLLWVFPSTLQAKCIGSVLIECIKEILGYLSKDMFSQLRFLAAVIAMRYLAFLNHPLLLLLSKPLSSHSEQNIIMLWKKCIMKPSWFNSHHTEYRILQVFGADAWMIRPLPLL